MSIVAAKKAAQNGFGEAARVLSGTMRYDNHAREEVYTFKAHFKGEAEPREFLFRVAQGQSWETELARRGGLAAELVRFEKTKEKAA